MKLNLSDKKGSAMTVFEVLVVVVCLLVVAAMLLPILAQPKRRASKINCISNVKQVALSLRVWELDNNSQYPMGVSVTNGGGMELIEAGNPVSCFQVASNEMSTTKILVCPDDLTRTFATNWDDLNGSHISYFLSPDASSNVGLSRVMVGDDNVSLNGKPSTSGLLNISSNAPVSWFGSRHNGFGNLGFSDGSVDQLSSDGLQEAFQRTGLTTNRIAIP